MGAIIYMTCSKSNKYHTLSHSSQVDPSSVEVSVLEGSASGVETGYRSRIQLSCMFQEHYLQFGEQLTMVEYYCNRR